MASTEVVGESLDFDFFETPRPHNEDGEIESNRAKPPKVPESSPVEKKSQKDHKNRDSPRRRSPSLSYSSDDFSSDTGSDTKSVSSRDKKKLSASKRKDSLSNSSLSSSASSRDSRSSSSAKSDKNRQKTLPKRGKSRLADEDFSSSAYSGGEGSSEGQPVSHSDSDPKRKDNDVQTRHKQAWDTTSDSRRQRPTTAKTRNRLEDRKGKARNSGSRSRSGSDSDITDVSPIESPRLGAAGDGGKGRMFKAMPIDDPEVGDEGESSVSRRGKREGASNLDLEILMKAVGELEKQKRVQANSRRVAFAPTGNSRDRQNYTFDPRQTRDIERENQRLLNEIVRRVSSGNDQRRKFHANPASAYRLTPSAINRERDMRRIESENMAFLKRLQKVKPTSTISRDYQLREYENTTLHGVPIAALHPLPERGPGGRNRGRRSAADGSSSVQDSASSLGSRTRSMTSIHSVASSTRSSKRGSRPSSATKRVDTRPAWSDRW